MKHKNLFPYFFFGILIVILSVFFIIRCNNQKETKDDDISYNTQTEAYLNQLNDLNKEDLEESERNLIEAVNNLKNNTTRIINPDNILVPYQCEKLDSILLLLDKKEIYGVVAICNHFKGDDPQDFSMGVGSYLGNGGPKSMGFVLALAPLDRSFWLSTGTGLEKIFKNEKVADMQEKYMVPYLRKQEWYQSLYNMLEQMNKYFESQSPKDNE